MGSIRYSVKKNNGVNVKVPLPFGYDGVTFIFFFFSIYTYYTNMGPYLRPSRILYVWNLGTVKMGTLLRSGGHILGYKIPESLIYNIYLFIYGERYIYILTPSIISNARPVPIHVYKNNWIIYFRFAKIYKTPVALNIFSAKYYLICDSFLFRFLIVKI